MDTGVYCLAAAGLKMESSRVKQTDIDGKQLNDLQLVPNVEMARKQLSEDLLLFCSKWAAERQQYFGDQIDISDVLKDGDIPMEFPISSGHLPPHR